MTDRAKHEGPIFGAEDPFAAEERLRNRRFHRQMLLPEVGVEGQARLNRSRVLVVGAGGLGVPVMQYLAAAGIGTLVVYDDDCVDESNLQRQVLFGVKDVGRPKAVVAADRLMEQFQPVRILARKQRFEVGDVGQVFPEVDLVLDCSDHIQTKYLLNDAAFLSGKPLIQAGLSQWQGQLGVLDPRDPSRGCLRCLWPHPGDERAQGTCAQVGILGPVAGILGAHQAMEAIKWLLALPTTKGWHRFDLLAMRFHALGRRRNPKCRLCGDSPELRTLEAEAYRGVEACRPLERPWSEVQASLAAGQGRVVDVRESFEREFLPMACLWQSYSALVASTSDLSADRPLYLVCQKGIKSYWLAERVRLGGGGSVFSVQGGWETFPQG